jgi:hypothetical protein
LHLVLRFGTVFSWKNLHMYQNISQKLI